MIEKSRNYCLDFIKGIACIFVVFMHCEFPGYLGIFVQSVSRFCVPLFFMTSGYFCFRKGEVDFLKKVKHIGAIILGVCIFYLIVTPIYQSDFSIGLLDLIKWLAFNVPPYIAPQLWFLFALFYDYILFSFCDKWHLQRFAYKYIIVGIILYVFLAQGLHLIGFSVPNLIYRNFLIEGFPLFTLGYYIHAHQERLIFSNSVLIITIIIATLLCPLERLIMGRDFGVNIVSFPQVIALFLFAVKNPIIGIGNPLTALGPKLSLFIYVIHPAIMYMLQMQYKHNNLNNYLLLSYMQPVLCLAITIMCSILIYIIKDRAVALIRS